MFESRWYKGEHYILVLTQFERDKDTMERAVVLRYIPYEDWIKMRRIRNGK